MHVCRLVCKLIFSFLWMPSHFIFCFSAAFATALHFLASWGQRYWNQHLLFCLPFLITQLAHWMSHWLIFQHFHNEGIIFFTFDIFHTAFFSTSISCIPNYTKVQQKRAKGVKNGDEVLVLWSWAWALSGPHKYSLRLGLCLITWCLGVTVWDAMFEMNVGINSAFSLFLHLKWTVLFLGIQILVWI